MQAFTVLLGLISVAFAAPSSPVNITDASPRFEFRCEPNTWPHINVTDAEWMISHLHKLNDDWQNATGNGNVILVHNSAKIIGFSEGSTDVIHTYSRDVGSGLQKIIDNCKISGTREMVGGWNAAEGNGNFIIQLDSANPRPRV